MVNALVGARYHFTMLNHANILFQLKKTNWSITPEIDALAEQLALPTNEPNSVIRVLADLAQGGRRVAPNHEVYKRFFVRVLTAFMHSDPDRKIDDIVRRLIATIEQRFADMLLRKVLRLDLLNGSSMSGFQVLPISNAMTRAKRVIAPLAAELQEALSCALTAERAQPMGLALPQQEGISTRTLSNTDDVQAL